MNPDRPPWGAADGRLRELVALGLTCREAAAVLGRTPYACQRRAWRLGLRFDRPSRTRHYAALWWAGLSDQEAADRLGVSATRVTAVRRKLGLGRNARAFGRGQAERGERQEEERGEAK